jgi:hypothetical protein
MILSGDYLAILEPSQTIFEKSPGKRWNLKDDKEALKQLKDQVRYGV